ncbi:MAG: hypothetical protein JSV09_15370 [Thermoplasmata archaeon]|nr:MAG: hypothetical protein JSV09_15370 [Thermoplasmata archaeon]
MKEKLIFVYNADSGLFSSMEDYVHKIIKPQTYQCTLCKITYGNLGMKKKWKEFIESLEIPMEFLHRDEFVKKYPDEERKFPVAYIEVNSKLTRFISQGELNRVENLEELMELVHKKYDEHVGIQSKDNGTPKFIKPRLLTKTS